ncbi:meiotic nuclear division protein 1 homolog [Humulus lupulus]|uniref:meiotic nuclear division protein 1 homolog n=1 Tax=Humulus lupulus TaxID=3486 RepID=UPI002B404072|nr:meiotic nuclear division protein 1 homolog [Humulus lupulus]
MMLVEQPEFMVQSKELLDLKVIRWSILPWDMLTQKVRDKAMSARVHTIHGKPDKKRGSQVYFWSLPRCAGNQLRNVTRKLESDLHSSKKRFAKLAEQCESLKKGREASDEREEALNELKSIQQKHTELKEEMEQYADNDPAAFEAMSSDFLLRPKL